MSLPACQQRLLDTIEAGLQKREPRLASMFAIFTRLTTDEGVPRTERLTAAPWWAWRRRRVRPRRAGRTAAVVQAALLMPLVIVAVVVAVFLGMAASQRVPCLPASGPHGLVTSQGPPKGCAAAAGLHRRYG